MEDKFEHSSNIDSSIFNEENQQITSFNGTNLYENNEENLDNLNLFKILLNIALDSSEAQIKDTIELINKSFKFEKYGEPSIFDFGNPYLKNDDVPEIEIIDENTMIYNKCKTNIKDYLEKLNFNKDNFLDDYFIYNF